MTNSNVLKLAAIGVLIAASESLPNRAKTVQPFIDRQGHKWPEEAQYKTLSMLDEVMFFNTEWDMQHFFKNVAKRATTFSIYQRVNQDVRLVDSVRTSYNLQ
jgi:hypothetical protein